jgi:O-acetyl-ADP-ribose deacetylase (regulator of RNase III)
MLHYTNTTVFNVGAQTIVNTVNCVGVMGAGLALECQLRFPEMFQDYVQRCKSKSVKIGKPYLYRSYGTPWIMNFPTKNHWKYPSKIEWIEQGLDYFYKNYERGCIQSIAFPKLGCDKGGLNWTDVQAVMENYLQDLNIDIYICLDRESEASGIEGMMTKLLNNKQNTFWADKLGIKNDISRKILASLPIKRFRDLSKIEGVGKQTYRDIFQLLYSVAVKEDSISSPAHEIQNLSNKLFPINAPIEATEISDVTLIQTEDKNKPTTNESIVIKSNSGYKLDTELRNDIMCQLKNIVGFNINELHQLKWCDIITNEGSGQVVVFGKVIPSSILQKMELIKYTSDLNNPVFSSNKGSKLSIDSIRKIIREVTKKTENINNVNDQLLEHIPSKQLELNLFKL